MDLLFILWISFFQVNIVNFIVQRFNLTASDLYHLDLVKNHGSIRIMFRYSTFAIAITTWMWFFSIQV